MTMNEPAAYFQPEVLSTISRLELRAQRIVEGFVNGMHKSPYKGLSIEFANHRPYVAGDDIRHIDWRVYAKADRFFIKEYEEETNMRVHLLLDCSGSMAYPEHPGERRMTKWDYAATLAVSMAQLLLYQQDAVGLTLFDHDVRAQLPVSTSRASLAQFLSIVESTDPRDKTNVKTLFETLAARVPRRGMVVVLSDFLTDVDDVASGLRMLRFHGHDVLVLHVLDEDELQFPFADRTLFEGMETPEIEVLSDPQSLRGSYLAALHAFVDRIRSICLDLQIDYSLISTSDAVDVALTTLLSRRMRRTRAG